MTTAEISVIPGRVDVQVDYRLKEQVKAVPGARWDGDRKVWTIPLSWTACLALRAEFGAEGLTLGPQLLEWAVAMKAHKDWLRSMRSVITEPQIEMSYPGFDDLYPYQRVGAQLISYSGGYLLTDETGSGKTRTALAGLRLAEEATTETILPCLIVAPKSVLVNWQREIEPFFSGADIRVVAGTPKTQDKALEPGGDFYIINYEGLRKRSRIAPYGSIAFKEGENVDKELQAIGFRSCIADEAHRVKSPTSIQTRALWAASARCALRVAMTGTPIQDTPEDLWPLLRFIAPTEYPTKTPFVDRYLDEGMNEWGGREILGLDPVGGREFLANFDARSRRLTKEVANPFLPPKVYEVRWVTLPPKLRKPYKDMEKLLVAELESGDTLTANSVMERANRLLQMANSDGTVEIELVPCTYQDCGGTGVIEHQEEPGREPTEIPCPSCGGSGKRERQKFNMQDPSPKVDAFMEDVKEGDWDGESVVVFSESRQLLRMVEMALTKKKIHHGVIAGDIDAAQRQGYIDQFQRGEIQFILLTRAGGEGITLTRASTMVRLVRSWSKIVHDQVEDRVHRIGSEIHDSINIIDYVTEQTVEETQIVALNAKEHRAQEVLRDADLLAMIKGHT